MNVVFSFVHAEIFEEVFLFPKTGCLSKHIFFLATNFISYFLFGIQNFKINYKTQVKNSERKLILLIIIKIFSTAN